MGPYGKDVVSVTNLKALSRNSRKPTAIKHHFSEYGDIDIQTQMKVQYAPTATMLTLKYCINWRN